LAGHTHSAKKQTFVRFSQAFSQFLDPTRNWNEAYQPKYYIYIFKSNKQGVAALAWKVLLVIFLTIRFVDTFSILTTASN